MKEHWVRPPQSRLGRPEPPYIHADIYFLLAFMFESSMQVTITDYAMKRTGKLHGERPYVLTTSSWRRKYEFADTAAPSSLVPDRTRAKDVGQPQGPVRQPP